MKVSDILSKPDEEKFNLDGTRISLEVYPPKVARSASGPPIQQHISDIFETVENLIGYDPAFVSVTYNPEGKTKATSLPLAAIIKQRFRVEAVAHLTCIATPRDEMAKTLDVLHYFDIENVLALRGDKPKDFEPTSDMPKFASELVKEIVKHKDDFCIGVAGYPEGHPECVTLFGERDLTEDLNNFKNKVDQGAGFSMTQLFLDNKVFFDFVDRARKAGVEVPILPGIMPVINYEIIGIVKGLCGASIPEALQRKLDDNKDDPKEIMEIGLQHAIEQCKGLIGKVPCIHFYTMDMPKPTERIIEGLK
jgi:methylenetetrahydrofolate reductase (NADPH)